MIKAIKAGGREPLWDDIDKNELQSTKKLRQAGIDEDLIYLADSAGAHKSALMETTRILNQFNQEKSITELQIAYLILHYVDDYTIGSNWADSMSIIENRGKINALDIRIDKNEANPNYKSLNEEKTLNWSCLYPGETPYNAQRRISHQIEQTLTSLLLDKTGQTVNPLEWPEYIDNKIKKDINSIKL